MKKRAICTIMVLMLFVTPCYRAYADAGTIAITGGSIAVGGAGTIATGAIAGPVVVAVFCGMMALGMNVSLTNASQQAGMTKTQFIKSKLEQYCHEAQVTYGVFNNAILSGTTILQNGAIKLGSEAGTKIKQFCNWLWNTDQIDNTDSGTGNNVLSNATYSQTGNFLINGNGVITNPQTECYAIQMKYVNSYYYYTYVFKRTSTNFNVSSVYNNQIRDTRESVQIGEFRIRGYANTDWSSGNLLSNIGYAGEFASESEFLSLFTNFQESTSTDTFTGSRDDWASGSNALDPTQDKSTVINPGLIGSIPVEVGTDVTVNINDYLDALQKVLDGIQTGIIARDKETDIPFTIPIPVDTDIDPSIDKEDDEDLPADQTPVTDPDKPVDPEKDPSGATNPLKFDLKNIFPFCIPFDIKDMLAKLNADPVAPNYHVDWNIPLLNTSLEFDINLTCWNSVAAILRKMELLSFIVGLAVVTRNLIRG